MTTKNNRTARSRVSATVLALALGLALLAGLPLVDGATSAARAAPAQVDLNSAALEEILALPVPADLARRIYEHRVYERFYGSVYELMEVDGMTAALLEQLKPLVATIPPPVADASIARLSASFRTVQNFLGEEGASEGLADEYLDRLRNPQDVNELDLYDLMSYQNVSPVDAAAVIRARGQMGRIEDERQLRGVEGLRYFSFRGLRDYVVYNRKQVVPNELTGFMQTRFWEAQPLDTEDDLLNFALGRPRGRYTVDMVNPAQPGWMNKVRLNHNSGVQAGLVTAREYGEPDWNETTKAFVGLTDKRRGNLRLKSLMFGNYRVAWGLGLIMDNTDYLKYRKTGFGFDTRPIGVYGDLSRSFEFALTGAAAEGSWGPVQATAFVSSADKDGVLNADGTINRYVVMRPRPDGDWLLDRSVGGVATGLRRNAFREDMLGGNVKVMLAPGTFLGVGGYEARYNRGFRADETTLVTDTSLLEARDAEIWNGYTSVYTDENGEVQTHKYRRVLGAEGQAVVANVSLQGEYAFLQDPRNSLFHKDNPDA
jgi:DNA uptake protein ComE-like DNA-binding protein